MNITIHYAFLPHTHAAAALGFYRDTLGFEVRQDVGYQDYGVRDCAFRDPAGNLLRINQRA